MLKNRLKKLTDKYKLHVEIAFVIVQAFLLYNVLFGQKYANEASFSIILLCFIFTFIFICSAKYNFLACGALFFTLISDFFLVLVMPSSNDYLVQCIAVTIFSAAHLFYFAYILKTEYGNVKKHVIIRCIISLLAIVMVLIVINKNVNYLAIICGFYFVNLITNCVYAFIKFKYSPLLAVGLALFICCDLFVGVRAGDGMFFDVERGSFIYKIFFADFNFTWLFYGFSQVFLVISINHNRHSAESLG